MFELGVIGLGNMGGALTAGIISSGKLPAEQVVVQNRTVATAESFAARNGCNFVSEGVELAADSKRIMLAVKPHQIEALVSDILAGDSESKLLISVAAGTTADAIHKAAGEQHRVIRVMPNTPSLIGAGASGIAKGPNATDDDVAFVTDMMTAVGIAIVVEEHQLHAVTGVSGSGPAYVYSFIAALADGGVRAGLRRQEAEQLAVQTVIGAAKMVEQTGKHPVVLRDAVASPGGTTIAAIHSLEQNNLHSTIMDAVLAASERSKELS